VDAVEQGPEHIPVLCDAFVDAIFSDPDGIYVDCTFGRGGHSRALLARLSERGRLLALDRDPDAVAAAEKLACEDARFSIMHAGFDRLGEILEQQERRQVNGVGFDLGVSSPQVDDARRGFSFQQDGPLDMRMDPSAGAPLSRLLEQASERRLADVLGRFGDERYARRIARAIIRAQRDGKLASTSDLENICFHAVPGRARHGATHPATRTFQALRIWVNHEFEQIEQGVGAAMQHLLPGGKLVVISFHSGEDRRVRDLVEAEVRPCTCPPGWPMCVCGKRPTMRWLRKKPVRPDEAELAANPRSRSARMRIAQRLSEAEARRSVGFQADAS
jgi:16S rRNA (cytosine1402-N4)-methyltransferase